MDAKWNKNCSSKNKAASVSEFEPIGRKNSKNKKESISDSSQQSINNGKARTHSVFDDGNNSKAGSKTKSEVAPNAGIKRQGSSKKGSRKSSTNEEFPPDMMVMSKRRQERIQINTSLANKQDEEDEVFANVKNVKTEKLNRSFYNRAIYSSNVKKM